MGDRFRLFIKFGELDYMPYGAGDMPHIRDLMLDYLIHNDMYERDEVQFKIVRYYRRG